MGPMNVFDGAVILLVAGFALFGLIKGLARIMISIASLVVAFLLANHFRDPVAARLMALGVVEAAARIVAYLAIFVATIVAGGVAAWLTGKLLKLVLLGWADRLAGAAVGLLGALLAAAFVVHPLVASSETGRNLLRRSRIAPYVSVVADAANLTAPAAIASRYDEEIERLRRFWRTSRAAEREP